VDDVGFGADGAATTRIRRSKTDQEGAGVVRFIAPDSAAHLRTSICAEGLMFRAVRSGQVGRRAGRRRGDACVQGDGRGGSCPPRKPPGSAGHSTRVGAA
jgi:hypothetical protein